MGRSLQQQITRAIHQSFCPGESKHAYKGANGRKYEHKIFSYSTRNELLDSGKDFAKFIKDTYGIKLVKEIKQEHVEAYLKAKSEGSWGQKCNNETLKQYASRLQHIGKCCVHVYGRGTKIDWKSDPKTYLKTNIDSSYRTIKMKKSDYEKVMNGHDSQSKSCLEICRNFGLRSDEVVRLRPCDIKENSLVVAFGKGGKIREIQAESSEQKACLQRIKKLPAYQNKPEKGRIFSIKPNSVNRFLQRQLTKSGITKYTEHKTGIHSIRKLYATEKYNFRRSQGLSHKEAWGLTSVELGHGFSREDLFQRYVK